MIVRNNSDNSMYNNSKLQQDGYKLFVLLTFLRVKER